MVLISANVAVHPGPGHDLACRGYRRRPETPFALLSGCTLLSVLMLSELPLPSLKFKHFKGWKGNEVIFLLIGIGTVLVALYGILAVPMILIIYLLSPLWGKLFPKECSDHRDTETQRKHDERTRMHPAHSPCLCASLW
jgi:hypothetical protein